MSITCIIVDDEPFARRGLKRYAEKIPFLQVKHVLPDAVAAMEVLEQETIDLMILDINMPELTGLQLLKSLNTPPVTIIITAYGEHALESFELDVIDYIMKPLSFERFQKAINKAKEYIDLRSKPIATATDYFFIKEGLRIEKVTVKEILFIESLQNYTLIYGVHKKYMALLTLKLLEQNLPANFVKVHKSFLVNIECIDSIQGDEIHMGDHRIPISKGNREDVLTAILGSKLLKRKP